MNKPSSKQACINCHFFIQNIEYHPFEVSHQTRESIRKRDYSSFSDSPLALACHLGVWDEGYVPDTDRRHEIIVETDRTGFCFYWPYRPGMLLPAATILQKRQAANREAARDRRLTVIGLWIAALALGANVIIELAKIIGWIK